MFSAAYVDFRDNLPELRIPGGRAVLPIVFTF